MTFMNWAAVDGNLININREYIFIIDGDNTES